ncbi:MAG TPA: sodium/solute symporter [Candidatus Anammoximicrobium sp.]|nr:sodium/solute symporter [Candidatus Anammoximicrobium sp.]
MGAIDILVFVAFVVSVIAIGLWKSKGEATHSEHGAQDYFLASRGLTWWLIGFSLIAANISTEQFVGMSGKAADWLGMAIASYEWMAAITLVVVAFLFLPTFLRSGIYTIPEFLQYRYNTFARTVMALCTMVILVGVPTASVIFSGAKVITGNFQGVTAFGFDLGNITVGCWIIGVLSAIYVFAGGLKACAWADLIQGTALVLGGVVIAAFAMNLLAERDPNELIQTARNQEVTVESLQSAGPVQRFWDLNKGPLPDGKIHMVRDINDREIPWTALIIGLWIPNFFYWGLNQYITQRTLGSKSLAEGQRGIVFAAFLKLIIPFIVVIPGILAYNLFQSQLKYDAVNRNAQILSEYSSELYVSLSEAVKPDRDLTRNKNIVAKIDENLSRSQTTAKPYVYKFDATFAGLHPQDAAAVVAYDLRQVEGRLTVDGLPAENAAPQALADFSQKLAGMVNEKAADAIKVETLVALDYDNAFPTLIRELLPIGRGIKGFVLAAIFGAVVSSIAAMLNSASTIFTMDIYKKLRRDASQYELVSVGRIGVVVFVLIAMVIAPSLGHPRFGGIFTFIQEFQGFISSGILAIFLFGVLVHRAPRYVGTVGLILNPVLYGIFKFSPQIPGLKDIGVLQTVAGWSFLDRMALCFGLIVAVLTLMTIVRPLPKPVDLPVNPKMDMTTSNGAKAFGVFVILLTLALYVIFW